MTFGIAEVYKKYLNQFGFSVFCDTEHQGVGCEGMVFANKTRYKMFSLPINSVKWIIICPEDFLLAECFCFEVTTQ